MKDAVVLAGSTPWSVLSLCKCAAKHKTKAYVVCFQNGWGRRYAHSRYVYKAYDVQEQDEVSFWTQFFRENTFKEQPVLYVTSDYVCQIVNRNRAYYESHFDLCVASSYILDSFINKNMAGKEAEKHGLTVPKTQELHNDEDEQKVVATFQFPVIVKPVTFRDHSLANFKTRICETPNSFLTFVSQFHNVDVHLQCQEYVKGGDSDCWFYQFYRNKSGEIVESMGVKTLQSNGIMTIGTTQYDEKLAALSRAFLNSIDYVGIGGIEYKRYEGQDYFIEMSTRTEGFLAISDMSGVSLAEAALLNKSGLKMNLRPQKEGIKYVVFLPWLVNVFYHNKWLIIPEWLKMIIRKDVHFVGSFLDWQFSTKLLFRLIK